MKVTAGGVQGAIALAGLGVVGFIAWRAYKTGTSIGAAAQQAVDQARATVTSAVANTITGPFAQGQQWATTGQAPYVSSKAWLYSDEGYTGNDASGAPIIGGEWYGNADARRYDLAQLSTGNAPAATSINGAAFGIYPRSGRRPTPSTGDFSRMDRAHEARQTPTGNT